MLLAIDIGNTNTVLGAFDGEKLVDSWRVKTDSRTTADEMALQWRGLLDDIEVDGISVCSTVPAVLHEVRGLLARYYADVSSIIVEPGVKTGVPLLYDNPRELGADRIVNSLAAFHLYGGPAVVVDFGTSTNYDVVSSRGEFLGGVDLTDGTFVAIAFTGGDHEEARWKGALEGGHVTAEPGSSMPVAVGELPRGDDMTVHLIARFTIGEGRHAKQVEVAHTPRTRLTLRTVCS